MSTKIEWTNETWNPVVGCSKVSPGCDNCYAEKMAGRLSCMANQKYATPQAINPPKTGNGKYWHTGAWAGGKFRWNGKTVCDESSLDKPLHWKKPRMIFVCSMSDLFHPSVPFEFINKIALVMARCPQHTFQVLTKRPEIALEHTKNWQKESGYSSLFGGDVWLGVTAENQKCADERIPILLQIPAAVRFVSIEPMLGAVEIPKEYLGKKIDHYFGEAREKELTAEQFTSGNYLDNFLDWVIVGGESGPGARHCKLEWIRGIVDQCKTASMPIFVKQLHLPKKSTKNIYRPCTSDIDEMCKAWGFRVSKDMSEWPEDLRIRQFPKTGE